MRITSTFSLHAQAVSDEGVKLRLPDLLSSDTSQAGSSTYPGEFSTPSKGAQENKVAAQSPGVADCRAKRTQISPTRSAKASPSKACPVTPGSLHSNTVAISPGRPRGDEQPIPSKSSCDGRLQKLWACDTIREEEKEDISPETSAGWRQDEACVTTPSRTLQLRRCQSVIGLERVGHCTLSGAACDYTYVPVRFMCANELKFCVACT